jgi:tRNA nucleotidyltransferase (CCA-adding enzyme)
MSLNPPPEVAEIASKLRKAGFEAWCVGGAVRDALLGHPHLDWDLATSARPDDVRRIFKRTVPVGIEFGTVGVLDPNGTMHEVTTFRKDVKTDGRHAVVEFGVSLDGDLARRDFTINAIAYDPDTGELRDPFDGRTDIKRGIVRAVGTAADRMREDRLRALRAIRFAARFRFHIEPLTWAAIRESAPHMGRLSAERVKQELEKTMQQVEQPSVALEWWRESGALATLVPSLATAPAERFRALDFLPAPGRDADAGATKGPTLTRLAMLFFGAAPADVERTTRALKFSNADAAWIVALARAWNEIGAAVDAALTATEVASDAPRVVGAAQGQAADAAMRRWIATIGRTKTDAYCELTGALHLARTAEPDGGTGGWTVAAAERERAAAFRRRMVEIAFRDPVEIADLAVDGEDLRAAGVPAGPEMGKMLRRLLERVIEEPALNSVEGLMALVRGEGEG